MAGIGFELRKVNQRGDLLGVAQCYAHSAFATSGPWIFTVVALASIVLAGNTSTTPEELATFRLIIVYNFAASLMLTGPVSIIITRYLADRIYERNVGQMPAVLVSSLGVVWLAGLAFATPVWLAVLNADPATKCLAWVNYLLVSGIWLVSVFLTALKNYRAITASFAVGMAVSVVSAALLAPQWPVAGMLLGFNLGLALILFALLARVFAEYPTAAVEGFCWVPYLRRHWQLAAGAVAYNLGIWMDKLVMWSAPEAHTLSSGLTSCPDYESATFLSYLTIVPAMAAFTVVIETSFFERYLKFYDDIRLHARLDRIRANQQAIVDVILEGSRHFLVVQGAICVTAIFLAPTIFDAVQAHFAQLGIFRIATLGALFHAGFLFLNILLSYFDLRSETLRLQILFCVANGVFTWMAQRAGFAFYGYGYFLASVVTFAAAFLVIARHLGRLPYQTFVVNNTSVVPQ
jgi:polysaccharide biosynthesis protein PelG